MTISKAAYVCAWIGVCAASACSRPQAVSAVNGTAATAATAPATPKPAAGAPASQTIAGRVLETIDASNYTYVRVDTGSKELWAAASKFNVAVGDTVHLSLDQPMENFHSASLNRDFPLIYFVSQMGTAASTAAPAMAVGHGGTPAVSTAAATVDAPIGQAKDGMTVAEIWKSRTGLAGRKVTVRGKVVKYNPGILGVNWIHIQDGSGKAEDGTNDITVTSEEETKLGEIITVTGTVALNKDLGSGYQYPVIIEHAKIERGAAAER